MSSADFTPPDIHRRRFLKAAGVTVAAGSMWRLTPLAHAAEAGTPSADQVAMGKDSRLIVHNSRTVVLETPTPLLRGQDLTPKDRFFVRNNQLLDGAATVEPRSLEGWKVQIGGLVERPAVIDAADLRDMPQHEVKMVMQCSGNGRSYYGKYSVKTKGTQWQNGGMGQAVYRGVPLSAVMDKFGINPGAKATYLTANGVDEPSATAKRPDFEHSVPVDDALEYGILALEMNGEPLPAIHGGPVRFILPGYYGTMNVKWIGSLRFDAHETYNYNQIPRYRTPSRPIEAGTRIEYTFENSVPNWRQKVKSMFFGPLDGDKVRAGEVKVHGVAWNDGVVPVEAVLVSADKGATWQQAMLSRPDSPYAWYEWQGTVKLPAGSHELWVRAVDTLGRSQPIDGSIHWNPSGYEWFGVERIGVTAA
ncbi:MAG: sulfite oxidase [Gammaproteobacteria bacterium]|nr:sulfite oxidase [Gammaproteobacteria bacterium]